MVQNEEDQAIDGGDFFWKPSEKSFHASESLQVSWNFRRITAIIETIYGVKKEGNCQPRRVKCIDPTFARTDGIGD